MLLEAVTLFPELITVPMSTSIMGRAKDKGLIDVRVHQLREHGIGKHRQVDDAPCGGGPGMVLRPEPLFSVLEQIDQPDARIIYLSPAGKAFTQADARRLSQESHLIFLCGHYEGMDQRVIDTWVDEELSIGDYVLTNGAIAASVIMDAIVRLLPGALGDDMSSVEESFGASGLLEAPHYTKPAEYRGMMVPEVLLAGHHGKIAEWRAQQSLAKTQTMRPDLLRTPKPRSAGCQPAPRATGILARRPHRSFHLTDGDSHWRSRGYIPHFDKPGLVQSITFRLADSLPVETVQQWQRELEATVAESERSKLLRRRIDAWLDQGHGACWLRDVRVAALVQESLLHFDGERYHLLAWCIMPNHVHVMIEMVAAHDLAQVVHSWKSFTSAKANGLLEREGDFWQRDYFDRFMRDGEHFDRTKAYIEHNPVAAGLVREKAQWPWSSASGDA